MPGAPDTSALPTDGRLLISRRTLLAAGVAGLAAAACGTISPSSATPRPSASAGPASPSAPATAVPPTATPAPTPTASADLRRTICGLLVVGFRGLTAEEAAPMIDAVRRDGLGGIILFDRDQQTGGPRNIESPDQLRALVGAFREAAGDRRLLVGIDQEGGRVARLTPATGFPATESAAEIGRLGEATAAADWGRGIAGTLADMGINLNLAPVVDLNVNPSNPAIGALDRSFSADPGVVSTLALAEIRAHHELGVATTLKHFPGLGSATTNTDFGVADVTDTWTRRELEPFRAIVDAGEADAIMAAHLVNRTLDPVRPASLSRAIVTDLLRGELGWDGVVITDDLQAAAITSTFGADEAIALALEAGNDLLLFANQQTYEPDLVGRVVDVVEGLVESGRIDADRLATARARVERLG